MITQATSIQIPWRIAQATRIAMVPTIVLLEFFGDFWRTWAVVYGEAK